MRPANEDQFLIADLSKSMLIHQTSLAHEDHTRLFGGPPGKLMLVADGMGGNAAGEVASNTALSTIIQLTLNTPKWVLKLDDPATRQTEISELYERAREFLRRVHAVVRGQAAVIQRQHAPAHPLDHLAVLGIEEAQPVLVDDLHLHALPFLPAGRADRAEDAVLDRGGEGDAVRGRGVARLAAADAGERHVGMLQNPSL